MLQVRRWIIGKRGIIRKSKDRIRSSDAISRRGRDTANNIITRSSEHVRRRRFRDDRERKWRITRTMRLLAATEIVVADVAARCVFLLIPAVMVTSTPASSLTGSASIEREAIPGATQRTEGEEKRKAMMKTERKVQGVHYCASCCVPSSGDRGRSRSLRIGGVTRRSL